MKRENAYLSDKQIVILKEKLLADKERIANKKMEEEQYQLDRNELSDPLDEASVNTAELCIACKEEAEMAENNNFYDKKSKSLGRALHDTIR